MMNDTISDNLLLDEIYKYNPYYSLNKEYEKAKIIAKCKKNRYYVIAKIIASTYQTPEFDYESGGIKVKFTNEYERIEQYFPELIFDRHASEIRINDCIGFSYTDEGLLEYNNHLLKYRNVHAIKEILCIHRLLRITDNIFNKNFFTKGKYLNNSFSYNNLYYNQGIFSDETIITDAIIKLMNASTKPNYVTPEDIRKINPNFNLEAQLRHAVQLAKITNNIKQSDKYDFFYELTKLPLYFEFDGSNLIIQGQPFTSIKQLEVPNCSMNVTQGDVTKFIDLEDTRSQCIVSVAGYDGTDRPETIMIGNIAIPNDVASSYHEENIYKRPDFTLNHDIISFPDDALSVKSYFENGGTYGSYKFNEYIDSLNALDIIIANDNKIILDKVQDIFNNFGFKSLCERINSQRIIINDSHSSVNLFKYQYLIDKIIDDKQYILYHIKY